MKLFNRQETVLQNVSIFQAPRKETRQSLTITDATRAQTLQFIENLCRKMKPDPINAKRTTVEVRTSNNGKNGTTESFKVYGLTPEQIKQEILNTLTNQ